MTTVRRVFIAACAMFLALSLAPDPAAAQQPVNPTASAVQEEALLNALQGGATVGGRVSIPDPRAADLIKPGNQDWRARHQGTMLWVTVAAVLAVTGAVLLFYLMRGPIRVEAGLSGVRILRFTSVERFGHWLTAGTFIVLAITGLNLVVGKFVLLPLIGAEAFTAFSQFGKLAHNFLAWPFMLGLILIFGVWVRENLPRKGDGAWLAAAGGMFGGEHPPAWKFNAGQKVVFWITIIGGGALSVTGVLLMFPYLLGTSADWQLTQVLHGVIGGLMTAVIIAHIYLGSVGMQGAFDAMGTGEVDVNWAREHHPLWVEELKSDGRAPAAGPRAAATPAE